MHSRSIDAGSRLVHQALELCETHGLSFQLPSVHVGLSIWQVWSGEFDRVRRHARRAVELSRQLTRPGWEALGLCALGAAAVLQADHAGARDWLSQAEDVLQGRGLLGSQYDMVLLPWVALAACVAGDLWTARTTAESIARTGRDRGSRSDEAMGEWLLGLVSEAGDRPDDARAHLQASRTLSSDPRLALPLGRSLLGLAALHGGDDLEEPWELAHEGLEVLDGWGDRIGTAAALETIGGLAATLGDPERTLRLLAASQRFHSETGVARLPRQADRFVRARSTAQDALGDPHAAACWEEGSTHLPLVMSAWRTQ